MKTTYEFSKDGVEVFVEKYDYRSNCKSTEYMGKFKNVMDAVRHGCELPWNDRIWKWKSYADAEKGWA